MTGIIVRSKAGHDKGQLFVISGVSEKDDGCVYIVDGKTRRIEKPKRKKLKHLTLTDKKLPVDESFTDKKIRETIKMLKAESN